MSRPKEIDEQIASDRDLLLLDLLYEELGDAESEQAVEKLRDADADIDADSELAALGDLRSLFRALPEEEPPAAISTQLMHAAAVHANSLSGTSEREGEAKPTGFWIWLTDLFRPIAMYPGLAAAASLVLIVTVAGGLYMSGERQIAEPQIAPSNSAPERTATTPAAARPADNPSAVPEAPASAGDSSRAAVLANQSEDDEGQGNQFGAPGSATAEQAAKKDLKAVSKSAGATRERAKKKKRRATQPRRVRALDSKADEAQGLGVLDSFDDGAPGIAKPEKKSADKAVSSGGTATVKTASKPPSATPVQRSTGSGARVDSDSDLVIAAETAESEPAPPPAPTRSTSAPRVAKKPSKKASKSNNTARIRSLHNEARDAAAQNQCDTVREAGVMIKNLDRNYYQRTFRKDRALARCFTD